MAPLSTTGGEASSSNPSTSTSSLDSNTSTFRTPRNNVHASRKRKFDDIGQAILESFEKAEEGRERRHKEKMDIGRKLLEKLNEMLKKMENSQ